jgi:hypothetical protein
MKTIKPTLIIIVIFLISSLLFFSCRVSKTAALRCPQVLTKKNNEVLAKYNRSRYTLFTSKYIPTIKRQSVGRLIKVSQKNHVKNIDAFKNSPIHENAMVSAPAYLNELSKIEYAKRLTASIDEKVIPLRKIYPYNFQAEKSETTEQQADVIAIPISGCDTIILKIGVKIPCKVIDIGQRKVTFTNCDDSTIPAISFLKSDVSAIKYSNGTSVSIISSNVSLSSAFKTIQKPKNLGLTGFLISLIGLICYALAFSQYIALFAGYTGIVLGIISLVKFKRHPGDSKGKLFAILSICFGAIDIFLIYLLPSLLIFFDLLGF